MFKDRGEEVYLDSRRNCDPGMVDLSRRARPSRADLLAEKERGEDVGGKVYWNGEGAR